NIQRAALPYLDPKPADRSFDPADCGRAFRHRQRSDGTRWLPGDLWIQHQLRGLFLGIEHCNSARLRPLRGRTPGDFHPERAARIGWFISAPAAERAIELFRFSRRLAAVLVAVRTSRGVSTFGHGKRILDRTRIPSEPSLVLAVRYAANAARGD